MTTTVRYLIAFVVGRHGCTHLPFGLVVAGALKGWRGRSWLLGSALAGDRLTALTAALHVGAGVAILASGAAIGLAAWAPGWWRPLAVVGAALGLAGLAVFWDGQTRRVVEDGAIGAALSLLLFVSAITFPRAY
jgi:hypothetical protein